MWVMRGKQEWADLHFDSEFFEQFPLERLSWFFAGLAFATGEFPEASEFWRVRPLGEENTSVVEDYCGYDLESGFLRDLVSGHYRPTLR